MLVDVDVPRAELVRLARGLTPAKLARVVGLLDPVELMFALKKLRARRDPGNQAHVTNLKESPALLAADAAEAARRGFDELETTVGVARYAPLNAIALLVGSQTGPARRDDAVRGGGAAQPRAGDPRPRHLRRDALGVRHRAGVRRRRRHAVVEGVPRRGVRLARRQGALHLGHGLGGADGARAGDVDALPRGALRLGRARRRRRRACRTGRSRALRSCSPCPAARARSSPRTCIAAWLDLEVASGNDAIASHSAIRKTAKLMGQFLPGHGLRDVRLLGDAAPRQHVRRRQLRRRRPRRVAHDPARLAGGRRDRAGRRGRGARACASALPGRSRRSSRSSSSRRSPTPRSRRRHAPTTPPTCPTATARPTSRRPTLLLGAASRRSTSRSRSTRRASRTSPRRSSGCSASASRPTTCRRRR